ncbi:MAG: OadG family protein [Clostridium sp.]|nr:OadG family protein [Clostridium sp.]MCM1547436.1 OadG family protein [Ruminococcus sp.]
MELKNLYPLMSKASISGFDNPDASQVTAVVITGLAVVFLSLVILIAFVWLFGKIFTRNVILIAFVRLFGKIFTRKKKNKAEVQDKPEPQKPVVSASAAPQIKSGESEEVIAVIAAAVAAMGAAEGRSYRLRSVKAVKNKPSRSAWSMAGIQNDTTPF